MFKPGVIFLLCWSSLAVAKMYYPKHCQPIPVKKATLTLKATKDTVFLIQNKSNHALWLTHTKSDPGASAGWTSELKPKKWSALTLNKSLTFGCVESKPGHEQQVACQEAVRLCQFEKITYPKSSEGSYWIAENQPLSGLLASIQEREFKLSDEP